MQDDKNKKAVALEYNKTNSDAPKVIAKGKGKIAQRIIEIAKQNNIHIQENTELTDLLMLLDLESVIPFEAYLAVAEILSYIYDKKNTT